MSKLDSILKSRDITLPTKVCLIKAMELLADFEAWLTRFKAVISDEYLDYLKEAKQHG